MQQVPVHKDNKKLREILREKISSCWSSDFDWFEKEDLIKEIEDYFLPTIIYNYYSKSSRRNFAEFVDSLDFTGKDFRYITKVVQNHLKKPVSITGDERVRILGDLHPSGSTKLLVKNSVVYKKYPDYQNLLFSIASCIIPDYKSFFPKISKKQDLFYRDFINVKKIAKNKRELRNFYLNLGRIIPLLLLLRAIDLNAENGLVNLPYPVFFDMETIFSGEFAEGFDDYGIKNSGLVKVDEKNDSSFLTGGLKEGESLLKPLICGSLKNPYIGWRTKSKGEYNNLPKKNNSYTSPLNYLEDLKEGYFDTAEKISQNLGDLKKIVVENEAYIRVVIRPTRMYRFLILKSCYPQVYLQGGRQEFIKKSLKEYNLIYRFKSKKLLDKEVEAILDLKVPVFYSSLKGHEIFCPTDEQVAIWYKTPYEIWEDYSKKLTKTFFKKQWNIIEESVK